MTLLVFEKSGVTVVVKKNVFDHHNQTPCWRWWNPLVSRMLFTLCHSGTRDSPNQADSDRFNLQPAANCLLSLFSEVLWRNWPQSSLGFLFLTLILSFFCSFYPCHSLLPFSSFYLILCHQFIFFSPFVCLLILFWSAPPPPSSDSF